MSVVRSEGYGVFTFPLFTGDFCRLLVDELANFEASGRQTARPNSMNDYGSILTELGLDKLATQLRELVLTPVARALFTEPSNLSHPHSGSTSGKCISEIGQFNCSEVIVESVAHMLGAS